VTVYVANYTSDTVTPISAATDRPGPAVTVGSAPIFVAVNVT